MRIRKLPDKSLDLLGYSVDTSYKSCYYSAVFRLTSKTKKIRTGLLKTKSGVTHTPFFMPIATKGAVKNVSSEDLKDMGAEIILGNTYHLWLRPGEDVIKKAGGLHRFMNWHGSILTDSGGYQVFSLGSRAEKKFGKSGVSINEDGVEFIDPVDGRKHFMSPEKSIDIQLDLGSDIIMVLDECPPFPCSYEKARESMELTLRWAERCKKHFEKKTGSKLSARNSRQTRNLKIKNKNLPNRPLLFGIVQGSVYEDLRKECAERLVKIGFDGYAIGGVAVGEPRKHLYEILGWLAPVLPEDKPRYLMGLGKPEEIISAVMNGIDMFDCVIPTREGRHGRLFVWKIDPNDPALFSSLAKGLFYETKNISNERFKKDFTPIDTYCDCYVCRNYTKSYLHYLLRTNEPLFLNLASIHNLNFYIILMKILAKRKNSYDDTYH
ncbi:MAG TPA: tRNA guanosine(34) transglycosylase Tgt [Candidatus Moranbacteria bacterium]|jgi:queuine tRNA-ribosyltransferase|nr:tRNA guanosine(34) transglycosylase Tgt [Candidatus Moranbacteria bacterium]HOF42617.1 tRNA guanosine(34) transglycosylase Tgt [Candidatus Moranbacteria bacterium]HPX94454.1 tRNA guanosine(34) transglycosylase Tgt [Candidatus Moranbacteria bacterium]HQB59631.1 tRNA guanosine(34) transglycosylase Tgt [Candidatus Moranbacteria bacterium]